MSNPEINENVQHKRKPDNVNTSGHGPGAKVPTAVAGKFNWGVFLLTWIWGLYHKKYLTLIMIPIGIVTYFIPFVGWLIPLGVGIWFGIKGNEWAWQGRRYNSIAQFHESQKKWAIAGIIVIALFFVLCLVFGMLMSAFILSNPQILNNMIPQQY